MLTKMTVGANGGPGQLRSQFDTFLNARSPANARSLTSREREVLFKEFLQWQQR